jgi:hypothetical protein
MATQAIPPPTPSGDIGARSCGFRENSQGCCGFRENSQVAGFGRPWRIFLKLAVFLITLQIVILS